ncbi:MAG: large subunit ribosomal protein [Mycobacterium sp.]|nr:large subunit ribosomal protein [Mycobacterium sp.]
MKPGIHPDYRPVVFQDANTGTQFLTRSTITSSRVVDWPTPDGARTYPLVVVEVTAGSHPLDRRKSDPRYRRPGRKIPPPLRPAACRMA